MKVYKRLRVADLELRSRILVLGFRDSQDPTELLQSIQGFKRLY